MCSGVENCLAHSLGDEKLIVVEESVRKIEAKVVKEKIKLDGKVISDIN